MAPMLNTNKIVIRSVAAGVTPYGHRREVLYVESLFEELLIVAIKPLRNVSILVNVEPFHTFIHSPCLTFGP